MSNGRMSQRAVQRRGAEAPEASMVEVDTQDLMDLRGQVAAVRRTQAVIEFQLDGIIVTANDNFLTAVGYSLDEIQGRHHRMFVDPAYAAGAEYARFWADLAAGKAQVAEYKRFGKGGREIWILASYNPILDQDGKPYKVIKFASDVTATKLQNADYQGQLSAIGKSQAVIEFDLDGTIRTANDNFLQTLGYRLDEVGSSRVDLQACKLEYSIVSPK